MLVIWRGFGWAIPVIVFASFLLAQLSLNSVLGEGVYEGGEWPKIAAVIVGSILIALLGYLLNYKKRIVVINEQTGKKEKSPSHTLFFISIEFWAIIVPVFFIWMQNY